MGLSLVELAIGRYPIPPPEPDDLQSIFEDGCNTLEDHMEAAKTGKLLKGSRGQVVNHTFYLGAYLHWIYFFCLMEP